MWLEWRAASRDAEELLWVFGNHEALKHCFSLKKSSGSNSRTHGAFVGVLSPLVTARPRPGTTAGVGVAPACQPGLTGAFGLHKKLHPPTPPSAGAPWLPQIPGLEGGPTATSLPAT